MGRTSADCSVSCDVVSLGSSGRHSIGSSAFELASTVSEGGTLTSGLLTEAVKATGVGSGFDSGSMCEVSWRKGACNAIESRIPAASALRESL